MTLTLDLKEELTVDEAKQVKDFAEFLISRRAARHSTTVSSESDHRISFDGWAGCLAHVHPEMSDAEFSRFMLDERVREAME